MSADRSGQRLRRPGPTAATSTELRPAPRDGTAEPAVMAIHRSGMVADAEGTEYPIRPMSILEGEGRAIHDFMVGRGYSQSLETGMAYGVSTLWLADAVARVDGGHHIAIDPRQVSGYHSIGTLNVERAGLDDVVETYVEVSEYRLPKLAGAKAKLDFAFIDGRHLFDSALIDFFYVDRMLRVGVRLRCTTCGCRAFASWPGSSARTATTGWCMSTRRASWDFRAGCTRWPSECATARWGVTGRGSAFGPRTSACSRRSVRTIGTTSTSSRSSPRGSQRRTTSSKPAARS